ncbi:MAG: hypothetical protein RL033_507 [Pseudomonadota bacterium]|jgi:hypothetical protein
MKNDNQPALDLFNDYSAFALTNEELLAIHGGTSPGGGASDSSSTHASSNHSGGGGDGGGGFTGMAVPPAVMQGVDALQRGAAAVRDAGQWALEKAADAVFRAADPSGVFKGPIMHDVVVPPRPQA